jgi:threonine/homoserine/homoserine lactone efflux protein
VQLVAFLAVAAVVIVTPGPDTALIIRNTLRSGRRGGVLSAAGVITGQVTWTVATAAGVAAALAASEPVFRGVRYAGAAYLVYLGVTSLRGMRAAAAARSGAPFRQGLVSNLTNPKMVVFFPALLPQFARSGEAVLAACSSRR